jgi:hypothetical protein
MTMASWSKVTWSDASQVIALVGKSFDFDDDSAAAPMLPATYFQMLVDRQRLSDAATFVSHALPRYEGIVWAVQSLRTHWSAGRSDALVTEILRWIDNPSDEQRRAIRNMADALPSDSPAALLGLAVFLSGGSISEPELPAVLPPPDVSAKLAAAAVLKAAFDETEPTEMLMGAISIGQSIASMGLRA